MDGTAEPDVINFGDVDEVVDELLQAGVRAYGHDPTTSDAYFRQALAISPSALPVYFCLYKIHTYQGNLEAAQEVAEAGLAEAARQAQWSADWRLWKPVAHAAEGPGRFALYTLKALAFINLRQDNPTQSRERLAVLRALDPEGGVGWPVVAALAEAML